MSEERKIMLDKVNELIKKRTDDLTNQLKKLEVDGHDNTFNSRSKPDITKYSTILV